MSYFKMTDAEGRVTYREDADVPEGAFVFPDYDAFQADIDARIASAPPAPHPVSDQCTKLGFKRALFEAGTNALFSKPEWPAVKIVLREDEHLAEEWDLAGLLSRNDSIIRAIADARKYDVATVDKIFARANELAA